LRYVVAALRDSQWNKTVISHVSGRVSYANGTANGRWNSTDRPGQARAPETRARFSAETGRAELLGGSLDFLADGSQLTYPPSRWRG
jgi:hypothetical protein